MRFSSGIIFHGLISLSGKGWPDKGHTLRWAMPFLTHNQITLRIQFGKNNVNIAIFYTARANGNQNFNHARRRRENSSK